MKKTWVKIFLLSLLLTTVSCTETEFQNLSSGWVALSTTVISNPKTEANGKSELILQIKVHDVNGKGIANVKLKALNIYENITYKSCTVSDENGFIWCRFSSTWVGTRSVTLFDDFGRFPVDLTFVTPERKINSTNIAFSEDLQHEVAGYKIRTKLKSTSGKIQNVSGYRIDTFNTESRDF